MAISELNKIFIATAVTGLMTLGTVSSAQAAAITFEGNLIDGDVDTGVVDPGNNTFNPDGWDFWTFFGNEGDVATITVNRLVEALDPALAAWFGTEADTSDYTSIFSDSANTPQVAFADDEIPNPGPFGDPTVTFTLNVGQTGFYTIGVTSFLSDPTSEPLAYQISLTGSGVSVPEPASVISLLGIAALGFGSALKRKQKPTA